MVAGAAWLVMGGLSMNSKNLSLSRSFRFIPLFFTVVPVADIPI
jgi:hypothetical protein